MASTGLAEIMGHRREQRVAMTLRVRVSGTDRYGNSFVQDAQTREISRGGARLQGLPELKGPGALIEIEYRRQKAHFVVVWIGLAGSSQADQAGVRCVDTDACIWGVNLPAKSLDGFALPPPQEPTGTGSSPPIRLSTRRSGEERRRYQRYTCIQDVQVFVSGAEFALFGTLTDISLGGGYVETMSPLPLGSQVELLVAENEQPLRIRGTVVVSQQGMGMAVAFPEPSTEELRAIDAFIDRIRGRKAPAAAPAVAPAPELRPHETSAAGNVAQERVAFEPGEALIALEALLEKLEEKGVLTRGEFLQSLERARNGKRVA
jgi:hypothetical protein